MVFGRIFDSIASRGGICNDAWLDRHEKFSFCKKNRTGSEELGSSGAKTLLAKFKDTANESRRDLVMLAMVQYLEVQNAGSYPKFDVASKQ